MKARKGGYVMIKQQERGEIGEYTGGHGYAIYWYHQDIGLYLFCGIIQAQEARPADQVVDIGPVQDMAHFRVVCSWLHSLPRPARFQWIPAKSTELWHTMRPGQPGYLWRGAIWDVDCYLLKGPCRINMMQAFLAGEPFGWPDIAALIWAHLAEIAQAS